MNEKDDLKSNKALISQKLNKPFVVLVGKVEDVNIVEKIISVLNLIQIWYLIVILILFILYILKIMDF